MNVRRIERQVTLEQFAEENKQAIFAKLFQTERTDILSIVILNMLFIKRERRLLI